MFWDLVGIVVGAETRTSQWSEIACKLCAVDISTKTVAWPTRLSLQDVHRCSVVRFRVCFVVLVELPYSYRIPRLGFPAALGRMWTYSSATCLPS